MFNNAPVISWPSVNVADVALSLNAQPKNVEPFLKNELSLLVNLLSPVLLSYVKVESPKLLKPVAKSTFEPKTYLIVYFLASQEALIFKPDWTFLPSSTLLVVPKYCHSLKS